MLQAALRAALRPLPCLPQLRTSRTSAAPNARLSPHSAPCRADLSELDLPPQVALSFPHGLEHSQLFEVAMTPGAPPASRACTLFGRRTAELLEACQLALPPPCRCRLLLRARCRRAPASPARNSACAAHAVTARYRR